MKKANDLDTQSLQNPVAQRKSSRRLYWIALAVGILIGVVLSVLGTIVLFNLGFFDQFYYCPPSMTVQSCPPEEAKSLDLTPTPSATPVPSATPTPDLGATATAACGTFESQFPGTPCPDSSP